MYIYQLPEWSLFRWSENRIGPLLGEVRYQQGRLLGRMESYGFPLQEEASLQTLTLDVTKSSEIEGEILNPDQVRSSIARHLGMDIAGLVPADRNVDGIVEMMLDATQVSKGELTYERLFGWHASLFPAGRSGTHRIVTGGWRKNPLSAPMQVVSGPIGRERVHFQAPDADAVPAEMNRFLNWFNSEVNIDPVVKAGIAHLWFVTIHPFDDGNGRIARAIADMQLARADASKHRFYSMSAQIRLERNAYYDILEETQKGSLDVTLWMEWFLSCLGRAIQATDATLAGVIRKAKFWEQPALETINERQRTMLNKLLDGFYGKLTSSKWAAMTKTSQDTAVRDIQDLIDRGLLEKEAAGGRSTSYILKEIA